MRFRTRIESFSDASTIDGERLIKNTFSVTLNGYILPQTFDGKSTTQKYLTPKKIVLRESADTTIVDDKGRVSLASNSAVEGGDPAKDIYSINISNGLVFEQGTGVTITNNGVSFDGTSPLTQEFSIGQAVGTTDSPTFNSLTANSVQIGTGTTVISDGAISSSTGVIEITGSTIITGSLTVLGDVRITGSLTADSTTTQVTTRSIDYSTSSNQFGQSLSDTHEFTGSVDITGSLKLNGYSVDEISNDTSLTDASQTALVTEYVLANTSVSSVSSNDITYLRKNFYKTSAGISGSNTASFTAVTASAPSGMTSTSENDFVFFINGQYMEHDAISIEQKNSTEFLLKVDTDSIGYELESNDEVLGIGKFNS
jgi:hypothetical protein